MSVNESQELDTNGSERAIIVLPGTDIASPSATLPAVIRDAPANARFAWEEFFGAKLRNAHTRRAYLRTARRFFDWCELHEKPLTAITPAFVGGYLDQHPGCIPTRKLALAAIRGLFDNLVMRHVIAFNPAASVRGERYSVSEGKTPELTVEQARTLLASVDVETVVGLRDRAILGVLTFTGARAGAIAALRRKDLDDDGTQWCLLFNEKGNKSRSIPVRQDLEKMLFAYLGAADGLEWPKDAPLFRAVRRKEKVWYLTERALTGDFIWRLVKRRVRDARLPDQLRPHSFRVKTVTNLLEQGVSLEDVQYLVGHADPRTTRLYDRRLRKVTRNIVERIPI